MASSSDLPPGCRFNPDDTELISAYLRPMIARERLPEPAARFLHSADVYAADPATLIAGYLPAVLVSPTGEERRYWYFFGSAKAKSRRDKRRSRVVGGGKGKWHSEKGRKVVSDDEGQNIGGYKQDFTYKHTNTNGSETEVWLMVEFGVDQQGEDETGKSIPTLCKIYQNPHKPKSSTPISCTSSTQMRKRKARDTPLPASYPVRRRLLVSPVAPIPPPPVQPQPDLNNYLDGVSWDQLLQDLMSGLTPDQVLGDLPVPESNVNCSFYMADHAGSASTVSTYADHAGSAISSYCGARTPFPDNSDQVLLGDLLMPVPESEVNYSFSMSDHAGSTVSTYDNTVLHGGSVTPFSENSDQADFFMSVFGPQPVVESQGQSTMLNCSLLPCVPNAGISGSWTGGDTTDDEAASISCWAHALGILCRLIINEGSIYLDGNKSANASNSWTADREYIGSNFQALIN